MNKINHVAIIMDGNGRWAEERSRPRFWGHVRGSHIVSDIVKEADEKGIGALTLYAFSTENWSRPMDEIQILFKLLKKFILKEKERILNNNIRFKVIGDISALPEETKNLIKDLEEESSYNSGLKLNFAFGYGGRKEIVDAVNYFIKQNPGKELTEIDIEKRLLTNDIGDVDLLIRTGGDQRISNFLIWQTSYAELVFTETPWPLFSRKEFSNIIDYYSQTERRFGSIPSQAISILDSKKRGMRHLRMFQKQIH